MPKTKTPLLLISLLLALSPALLLLSPPTALSLLPGADGLVHGQTALWIGWLLWALLAWRLNQNRLAVLAVLMSAAAQWTVGQSLAGLSRDAANGWLLAVPAGLGLSLLPREGALLSERTFLRLALLFLPAGLAWAVASGGAPEAKQLLDWRLAGAPGEGLSQLAHLGLLVLGLGLALRWHAKVEAVLLALLGVVLAQVLLAWSLDLAAPVPAVAARIWLASHLLAWLCFSGALFLLYWQRVYLDELTGIPNRRALDEKLAHLQGTWSLAMVDIDHFKRFNDSYGHDQGDDVLRLVARHLADGTAGKAFRYGGEEFCVLAPGEASPALAQVMDAVREDLARRRFHIRLPKGIRKKTGPHDRGSLAAPTAQVQVTISVGVARPDKKHPESAQVLKLADEGLYEAKDNGRNNVVRMN